MFSLSSSLLRLQRHSFPPRRSSDLQPQILDVSGQADVARQILSQPLTLVIPNANSTDPGPYIYNVEVLANILAVQRVQNGDQISVQVGLNPTALRDMLVPVKA